jgi:hypothetical protein
LAGGVSVRAVTRTNRAALDALIAAATVDCATLEGVAPTRFSNMHGMKGIEFRCVILAGGGAATMPPPPRSPRAARIPLHTSRTCNARAACSSSRARDALHVSYSGTTSQVLT